MTSSLPATLGGSCEGPVIRHVPQKPSLGPNAEGPALSSEASWDFPGWEGGGHQPSGILKGSLEDGEEQEASEPAMLQEESD